MACFLVVLLSVLLSSAGALSNDEPSCLSNFDFNHKLLTKVVLLETEKVKLLDKLSAQETLINHLSEAVETLEKRVDSQSKLVTNEIEKLQTLTLPASTGSTYVRWGKTTCPGNGTDLVYRGYAGGSWYGDIGAAANYLCMPAEPLWGHYEDGTQSYCGQVHGAEYQLDRKSIDTNFGDSNVHDNDVPCAVCRTQRASILMIPARNDCYDGWTVEYAGYLTSGDVGHNAATEYVCLDSQPESLKGGANNADGKLFYYVESRCGSLRCPPYVHGRELTCVVCSK